MESPPLSPPVAPPSDTLPTRGVTATALLLCLLCLVATGALRWWSFPQRYELRDMDEVTYTAAGLTLFEGTPSITAAPGGPEQWISWAACAAKTARYTLAPTAEERAASFAARPYFAANHALFDLYRDLSGLRRAILIVNAALALLATCAAFRVGHRWAGAAGALLLGGLMATLPMFVDYANQARPYSAGWSLAMLALGAAVCGCGNGRSLRAGALLGLAIASRVDMLAFAPVVLLQFWDRPESRPRWRSGLRVLLAAAAVTLIVAPWFTTNLVENVRNVVTVRFFPVKRIGFPATFRALALAQGLLAALLLVLAGIPLARRGERAKVWTVAAYAALLVAAAFRGSGFGLHQEGAAFLALATVAALALRCVVAVAPRAAWAIALIVLALPVAQGVRTAHQLAQASVEDSSIPWLESHVSPGTRVFVQSWGLMAPVPTPEAANREWAASNEPDLALRKFHSGLKRMNLFAASVPRAFSEANVLPERWATRRPYVLGGRPQAPFPRYDVVPASYASGDLIDRFLKEGGVLITREPDPARLGQPYVTWARPCPPGEQRWQNVSVYVSPDVRAAMQPTAQANALRDPP